MKRPPELEKVFEALAEQNFASAEDANRWLTDALSRYNDGGQSDMGGLSPNQMMRFMSCRWGGRDIGRIATDLELADVEGSAWWQASRTLLRELHARGPVTFRLAGAEATWTGIADSLWEAVGTRGTLGATLVAGPADPKELIAAEAVALLLGAKLLTSHAGTLKVTPRGAALMADSSAGELNRLLLLSYLREMDIVHLYQGPDDFEVFLESLPYTVYRLQQECSRWRGAAWLSARVFHPSSPAGLVVSRYSAQLKAAPLGVLIYQPLVQLDLLEMQSGPKARLPQFRSRPLFERAITFAV